MSAQFSYTQARIQARHGQRPDESTWARLEASKSLAHYLESARGTGLERWMTRIDAKSTARDIERAIRAQLKSYIEETAKWMPAKWKASVESVSDLIDLPLRDVAATDEWAKQFRSRWPRSTQSETAMLEALVSLIAAHRDRMQSAERGDVDLDGWELRRELAKAIQTHFRRHGEQPSAVFAHLVLVALDLERLRAALIERALFEDRGRERWD